MNINTTEVYKYFRCIEMYALGDLNLLSRLAVKAEEKEENNDSQITDALVALERPEYSMGSYSSIPPFEPICRGTIPFTLMIFSCMDVIGYLVRHEGRHTETENNIIAFFEYVPEKPSNEELKCLVQIYRHGLAHNYFPKLGLSISYHSKNPDSLFFRSNARVVLNVNKLELYFKVGFMLIKGSVNDQMEFRFNQLTEYYQRNERCTLFDLPV